MEILVIKFVTPKNRSLTLKEDKQIKIESSKGPIFFKITVTDIAIYNLYTLKSNELQFAISEEDITKIWESLYLLCMEFGISILTNMNILSSFVPKHALEKLRLDHNINAISDFVGVRVVPSDALFVSSLPPTVLCESDIKIFEELLNKYISLDFIKNDRIIRAIEIFNSTDYLTIVNESGRFILLMAAIESLIKQPDVSQETKKFIEYSQNEIDKFPIETREKNSIKNSLGKLKRTSIRRAGKNLIELLLDSDKKYNGFSPTVFFDKAYELRSRFVHDGFTYTDSLNMRHNQLYDFTKDLIINYFNKVCNNMDNALRCIE